MKKGVTVEQVARVTRAFTDAGVMVHAYLMYGFPTETAQETVDALERVRQLFAAGLHPVGVLAPLRRHRAQPDRPAARSCSASASAASPGVTFARNELAFDDPDRRRPRPPGRRACARRSTTTCTALGLDLDVRSWFSGARPRRARRAGPGPRRRPVPTTQVPPDLIANALRNL